MLSFLNIFSALAETMNLTVEFMPHLVDYGSAVISTWTGVYLLKGTRIASAIRVLLSKSK